MLGVHDYWIFVAAGVLLNLTPGQDTFYILGRSVSQGRRIGVVSALGIAAGSVVHTCAAALGLSAILGTSATAFTTVKMLGAAYLVYLGLKMLLRRSDEEPASRPEVSQDAWAAFRQGMLTNLLNPKVALFFLAFVPQFIEPSSPSKITAFLVLGATFVTTGTIWCLVLAVTGARMRTLLVSRPAAARNVSRASGGLFIALGLRLAASRR